MLVQVVIVFLVIISVVAYRMHVKRVQLEAIEREAEQRAHEAQMVVLRELEVIADLTENKNLSASEVRRRAHASLEIIKQHDMGGTSEALAIETLSYVEGELSKRTD